MDIGGSLRRGTASIDPILCHLHIVLWWQIYILIYIGFFLNLTNNKLIIIIGWFQGATVRNEDDAVVIGRIVKGGTAEKSGE